MEGEAAHSPPNETPILLCRPSLPAMNRHSKPNPEVWSIVREYLEPNECILTSSMGEHELTVRLIDKNLKQICDKTVKKHGRGSGMGRVLQFKNIDGTWEFLGDGTWIS